MVEHELAYCVLRSTSAVGVALLNSKGVPPPLWGSLRRCDHVTKILVADDDTVMLNLLTTLMQLEGIDITTVTRPAEIIPAVEQEQPDLILMDYHLAGGDVM
jgi:PleD family two-component response regulator